MKINKIYCGDALETLKTFPNECVNCCVTSPPYYGLRDYGVKGQMGLEETPEEYVKKMVEVFSEVKRVLKKEGTVFLNLGDSYWGGKGQSGHGEEFMEYQKNRKLNKDSLNVAASHVGGKKKTRPTDRPHNIIKPKDLIGIPWMVAFALRTDGWYLRQDIIWAKGISGIHNYSGSVMPESVIDRCTKSHEYIFLLSKSKKYYYDIDAIKEEGIYEADVTIKRKLRQKEENKSSPNKMKSGIRKQFPDGKHSDSKHIPTKAVNGLRNKRSVWAVSTKPFKEAHFAVFPPKLIEDCIKAGCPEDGIVLDPFIGSGTTAIVARKQDKNFVGIELNPDYIQIAEKKMREELGLYA